MNCAWITFAEDNEAVQDVLILLNSLRKVYTSNKILVILGESLTKENIARIRYYADYVSIFQPIIGLNEQPRIAARCQAWTLSGFARVAYLDPTCLVLQNIDNLFKIVSPGFIGAVESSKNDNGLEFDDHLILFEPSFEIHQLLTQRVQHPGLPQNFRDILKELPKTQALDADKYGYHVDENAGLGLLNLPSIAVIQREKAVSTSTNNYIKDILRFRQKLNDENRNLFTDFSPIPQRVSPAREPVAIIGMSCRFPCSNSVSEFWELLISGENGIGPIPPHRWLPSQGCIVEDDKVEAGFLKCPVDEIDAEFFGFTNMELKYTDPQQRMLLEVAYEALQDAGIPPKSLAEKGTVVGICSAFWKDDYKELMIESGFKGTEFFRTYMGNAYSASSARLSHTLNITGANTAAESGCSASFVAVKEATQALRNGEIDVCIVSAVNLLLHPFKHEDMKSVLSKDFRCKTFDSSANGFVRSEGVASLILKRFSDAVRDGDRIHGIVRGIGMTQEGASLSMGTPTVETEAAAMTAALKDAGVNPNDVDYLEAHGTGTYVGDPIEVNSVTHAYLQPNEARKQPLLIGSLKTIIGHTEAAAGLASIIKTLLSFKHEVLPPHRNVVNLNPSCDFSRLPAQIPINPTMWKKSSDRKRIAGISNFGIAGGDTHMILEEPPNQLGKQSIFKFNSPPQNIITLSAKTATALAIRLEKLEAAVHNNPYHTLDDIAYTANTSGDHYLPHRLAIVASDSASISSIIAKKSHYNNTIDNHSKNRICFMFPGQGTQYVGMGKDLYALSPVFAYHVDLCADILIHEYQFDVKNLMWSNSHLENSVFSQVAIFVIEYSLAQLWISLGVVPTVVVGHSLGDFVAAIIAQVYTLKDGLKLVLSRCNLVATLPTGAMAVVLKDVATTEKLVEDFGRTSEHLLDIAAENSPSQTTVTGNEKSVIDFLSYIKGLGKISAIQLNSSVAYHSRCLDPILNELETIAKTIKKYSKPNCTFISSVSGQAEQDFGPHYWVNQTRNRVKWAASSDMLVDLADVFIDMGAHPILNQLLLANISKTIKDRITTFASITRDKPSWETFTTSLAKLYSMGVNINWSNYHKFLPGNIVDLPHYPWQRKKYWFTVNKLLDNKRSTQIRNEKTEFPLIGSVLQTPPSNTVTYVNYLSLKNIPYVADHKLGEYAVFPGAGYIEMFLEIASKFNRSLIVHSVRFRAPLVLTLDDVQECHTVFQKDTGKAQIYCRISPTAPWIFHVEAEISDNVIKDQHDEATLDISKIISTRNLISETTSEVYPRIKKLGYNFGPQFQTIQKIYNLENNEYLVEITDSFKGNDDHVCHPITIDAILQAYAVTYKMSMEDFTKLHLPSAIGQFKILLPFQGHELRYVYVTRNITRVYDTYYHLVAVFRGIEALPSTVENIRSALEISKGFQQLTKTVPMFEESWIRFPTAASFLTPFSAFVPDRDAVPVIQGIDNKEIQALSEAVGKGIELALSKELSWNSIVKPGDIINAKTVISRFNLITASPALQFVHRLLEILEEDGYLKTTTDSSFLVVKALPGKDILEPEIEQCRTASPRLAREWETTAIYLKNIAPILLGNINPLDLLFPSSGSRSSAEAFYIESDSCKQMNTALGATFSKVLEHADSLWGKGKQIHIIEIGAGTGSATSVILPLLEKHGHNNLSYTYTYTDISSAYFIKAESKFSEYQKQLIFKPFNVEEPPESQGFPPAYYHIVVASNVLHATVDLTDTMKHTRELLRPRGLLFLVETFVPQRHFDIMVGHLDGYWRFKDFSLRPKHCIVSESTWHKVLETTQFRVVTSTPMYNGGVGVICAEANKKPIVWKEKYDEKKNWLIFSDQSALSKSIGKGLHNIGRHVLDVFCTNSSLVTITGDNAVSIAPNSVRDITAVFERIKYKVEGIIYMFGMLSENVLSISDIWKNYLLLIQHIAKNFTTTSQFLPKIIVITRGMFNVTDQSPTLPGPGTLSGITRTFLSEFPNFRTQIIDIDPDDSVDDLILSELISSVMWAQKNAAKDVLIAIRSGQLFVSRIRPVQIKPFPPLAFPRDETGLCVPFCLQQSSTNYISNLSLRKMDLKPLQPDQVEIAVCAVGLNFRDLLFVLRLLPQKIFSIGCEVSGFISRAGVAVQNVAVGDAVFAAKSSKTPFPSHAIVKAADVLHLPPQMTFQESMLLPTNFTSAYVGLIQMGNLKQGDHILIHTASGGVGIWAIFLAQEIGAVVWATAGSRRKRAYLKSLGIPSNHLFSSRDDNFRDGILQAAQKDNKHGRVIDVVLNSITGEGLKEASLSLCKQGARWVEMSKLNIWKVEEISQLRSDIKYHIMDLSDDNLLKAWREAMPELRKKLDGRLASMPITTYGIEDIRNALTHFERAKHVGKIVVLFPFEAKMDFKCNFTKIESPMFNSRSLYMLVGGLGGIGLKVAEWMLRRGAKYIVLTGRKKPTFEADTIITALNEAGGSVFFEQLDVSSSLELSALLLKLQNVTSLPPLRGVMNMAGILADAPLLEQNEEKFESVLQSKVLGSWNLHQLTMSYNLEHFVLFSSFAAIVGTPGQSNHAAGNSFEDALARFRHASGLPATSINWGQWGEVGIVAGSRIHGYNPMTTKDCIESLESVMTAHIPNVVAVDGKHSVWKGLFPWTESYFSKVYEAMTNTSDVSLKTEISEDEFWNQISSANKDVSKIAEIIKRHMRSQLSFLMDQTLEEDEDMKVLNLDSLMSIELRNSIQNIVGTNVKIPLKLPSGISLNQLTDIVLDSLSTANFSNETVMVSPDMPISKVVEEEIQSAINSLMPLLSKPCLPLIAVSDIKSVLFTGATGNLAPYILAQLSMRPSIQKIYCLVQGENESSARVRLIEHFSEMGLLCNIDMTKILVVAGSLGKPLFGLSETEYEYLASSVEAIFNIAASTSHLADYSPTDDNILHQVNVRGITDILLLASKLVHKHVFHASTIATIMKERNSPNGFIEDDWVSDTEFESTPKFGYLVSKFVGDKVIQGVLSRYPSLSIKTFRFALVCGESSSGRQDIQKSNWFLKYCYYIKCGLMPDEDIPIPLIPADHCATISLALFFNTNAPSDIYNVVNSSVPSELDLSQLAIQLVGKQLKIVPYSEWIEYIKNDTSKTCLIRGFKNFYTDPDRYLKYKAEMSLLNGWRKNRHGYFMSKKVEKFLPNFSKMLENPLITFERDMRYALLTVEIATI